ncbi:MAG: hypothetical protein ACSHWN_12370 [Methylophilaceae bacterium]
MQRTIYRQDNFPPDFQTFSERKKTRKKIALLCFGAVVVSSLFLWY